MKGWIAFWATMVISSVWAAAGHTVIGGVWLIIAVVIFFTDPERRSPDAAGERQEKT
jgi:hypothetical protein